MTNSKPQCTLLSESCSLNVWVHFIQISHTHSYGYSPPGERIEISALVCQLKRLCQFQWKWSSKSKPWFTFLSESYSSNAWVHLIQILHTHTPISTPHLAKGVQYRYNGLSALAALPISMKFLSNSTHLHLKTILAGPIIFYENEQ